MAISFSQIRNQYPGVTSLGRGYPGLETPVPPYTRYADPRTGVTAFVPSSGPISFSDFNSTFLSVGSASYTQSGIYSWTCPRDVTSVTVTYMSLNGEISQTVNNLTPGTDYVVSIGGAGAMSYFGVNQEINWGFVRFTQTESLCMAPGFSQVAVSISGGVDAYRYLWTTVATPGHYPISVTVSGGFGGGGSAYSEALSYGLVCVADEGVQGDLGGTVTFNTVPLWQLNNTWSVIASSWSNDSRGSQASLLTVYPPTPDDRGLGTWFVRTDTYDPFPDIGSFSFQLVVQQVVGLTLTWHP